MKVYFKLFRYAKESVWYLIFAFVSNILLVFFSIASIGALIPIIGLIFGIENKIYNPPIYEGLYNILNYVKEYIFYYITIMIDSNGEVWTLVIVCIFSAIIFLFKNIFRYMGSYFLIPVKLRLSKKLKDLFSNKIMELPINYFSNRKKGDLISRVITDVNIIQESFFQFLSVIMRDPFMIITSMAILFFISYKLTLFVIITLPFSGAIISYIGNKLKSHAVKAQKEEGFVLSFLDEIVTGLKVIKVFDVADNIQNIFKKKTNNLINHLRRVYRVMELAPPISEFMGVLVMLSILCFGGILILRYSDSAMSPEDLITYLVFFFQMIQPSKFIARLFYESKRTEVSMNRIFNVINQKNDMHKGTVRLDKFKDKLSMDNVYFAYEEKNVISNFSLDIKKGDVIALVGTSGSGKTTIANLLVRFHDLKRGKITIDGIDIKDVYIKDLRKNIGIITQDTILFNDTVYNNIVFGMEDVDRDEVFNYAKMSNAHDFIINLPNGYNTIIGDRGDKLSGGQKQRLHIARAMLKKYPIIIFDEATSSLDAESEKLIQNSFKNIMKDKTVIIITHKLSTIKKADRIIVLEDGEIKEQGYHDDLMNQNGIYNKLVSFQQIN